MRRDRVVIEARGSCGDLSYRVVELVGGDHRVTLLANSELVPALADFPDVLGRPGQQALLAGLEALGLNMDSDLERSPGLRDVACTMSSK